jgi:isocitrate lyase
MESTGSAGRNDQQAIDHLENGWKNDPRWQGVERTYSAADVVRLRGTVVEERTLARLGAERLWELLHNKPFIRTFGALTGNQAVQMVQAGLEAIYVSGWQVAGDMNEAAQTYPDQSLYPADSVPKLIRRLNNALARADQISHAEGRSDVMPNWYAPIVADGEAGFGGMLNLFELTKAMIEAGVAGVHYEDQLSSFKKCGHMGGKVLVPTNEMVKKLVAARLAADVLGVPTLIMARTDADSAKMITSDIDEQDHRFITDQRSPEGFFMVESGLESAIARGLAYAPYSDMIWCETSHPDLAEARAFAEAIHAKYPGKLLAYNCSPSFNWKRHLDDATIARFQRELGAMGYKFQFITLAGFHSINTVSFELAHAYRDQGMTAYARLQEREFELEATHGYRAIKHQSFVGAGYFDDVTNVITSGETATTALAGSTEVEQFDEKTPDFSEAEAHHVDGRELESVGVANKIVD